MSLSQTNVYAAPIDGPVTLNDFRLRSQSAAPATAKSTFGLTGIVLVAALAAGAFVMFDPLGMKAARAPDLGPAPLAMAPAVTVPSAPSAADKNSQLATPVPAPALAPAEPVASESVVTKSTARVSTSAPAARAAVTKHRTKTTAIESAANETGTTSSVPATPIQKPDPVETAKSASAATSSAPEAQVDSN